MTHFAKVLDGKVIQVIVAEPEFFDTFVDSSAGTWIQTSYNTRGGVHYAQDSDIPDGGIALRGNFASVGYVYDEVNDIFYSPRPYPSWTLSSQTFLWEAPIPYPNVDKLHIWYEDSLSWKEMDI